MLNPVPLEDELGDVLEKAMRHAGLNEEALGSRANVSAARIRDAVNYRPELSWEELRRLAGVLGLNEVGLCALGCGRYPLPGPTALPFSLHALRVRHGIGVANAYIVAELGATRGILFDTGPTLDALEAVWPLGIVGIDAVFLTHAEGEHVGGLCEVVERFAISAAFHPAGSKVPCGSPMDEARSETFGGICVTAFSTPGHAPSHNCYLVEATRRSGPALLIAGDLFFAGSVGGAHYCCRQLAANLRRMLQAVPPQTVIAPGHGPLTTAENELRFNPFVV